MFKSATSDASTYVAMDQSNNDGGQKRRRRDCITKAGLVLGMSTIMYGMLFWIPTQQDDDFIESLSEHKLYLSILAPVCLVVSGVFVFAFCRSEPPKHNELDNVSIN